MTQTRQKLILTPSPLPFSISMLLSIVRSLIFYLSKMSFEDFSSPTFIKLQERLAYLYLVLWHTIFQPDDDFISSHHSCSISFSLRILILSAQKIEIYYSLQSKIKIVWFLLFWWVFILVGWGKLGFLGFLILCFRQSLHTKLMENA